MNKDSDEEAWKLFKFIDFNNTKSVTKHQIKLFLLYLEGEYKEVKDTSLNGKKTGEQNNSEILKHNHVYKTLKGILKQKI